MAERRVGLLLRIPEGLKKRIVDLAKREHRSVNQQIEFLLEQSIATAKKTLTGDKARESQKKSKITSKRNRSAEEPEHSSDNFKGLCDVCRGQSSAEVRCSICNVTRRNIEARGFHEGAKITISHQERGNTTTRCDLWPSALKYLHFYLRRRISGL